jgi:hypothetical protein
LDGKRKAPPGEWLMRVHRENDLAIKAVAE